MTTPKPVLPHHVMEGRPYWVAWGNKGWSAVLTLKVMPKWAEIVRVNAKTNERISKAKCSKAKRTEFIKRDPKLKGDDKPEAGPAVIFAEVRAAIPTTSVKDIEPETPPEPPKPPRDPLPQETIDALVNLIPEDQRFPSSETCECRGRNLDCPCW